MENRIRDAAVFWLCSIKVVRGSVFPDFDVLEQRVGMNGAINIRLRLFRQVNRLGIASTLEIENALVVPAVFIVSNQGTVRISRQCGLARPTQTKKEANVSVLADVGRAMHWKVAIHRQPVVHQREQALLVLSSIPVIVEKEIIVASAHSEEEYRQHPDS
jgi:hypothetical protein